MIGKWAAYHIPVQDARDRHLSDAATLVSLIADPRLTGSRLVGKDRVALAGLLRALESNTSAWRYAVDDVDVVLSALALLSARPGSR